MMARSGSPTPRAACGCGPCSTRRRARDTWPAGAPAVTGERSPTSPASPARRAAAAIPRAAFARTRGSSRGSRSASDSGSAVGVERPGTLELRLGGLALRPRGLRALRGLRLGCLRAAGRLLGRLALARGDRALHVGVPGLGLGGLEPALALRGACLRLDAALLRAFRPAAARGHERQREQENQDDDDRDDEQRVHAAVLPASFVPNLLG